MEVMGREKSDKSTNQGPARMCNLCMCWEQGREQASYEHAKGISPSLSDFRLPTSTTMRQDIPIV